MRSIDFRIWSEADKCYRPDLKHVPTCGESVIHNDEGDTFILEQYTGRNDINNRKIYEGDIVRDGTGRESPVEYRDCGFWFGYCRLTGAVALTLEVVGNIHKE